MAGILGPVSVPTETIFWSPKTLTPEFRPVDAGKHIAALTLTQVALQRQRAAYSSVYADREQLQDKCNDLVRGGEGVGSTAGRGHEGGVRGRWEGAWQPR